MQWPPEDSQCYAWLPEPGTAAEWTKGGFGSAPSMKTPFAVFLLWGGGGGRSILGEAIIYIYVYTYVFFPYVFACIRYIYIYMYVYIEYISAAPVFRLFALFLFSAAAVSSRELRNADSLGRILTSV